MNRVDAVLLAIIVNMYCKAARLMVNYYFLGDDHEVVKSGRFSCIQTPVATEAAMM